MLRLHSVCALLWSHLLQPSLRFHLFLFTRRSNTSMKAICRQGIGCTRMSAQAFVRFIADRMEQLLCPYRLPLPAVQIYDPSGERIGQVPSLVRGRSQGRRRWCMANRLMRDKDGRVVVCDRGANVVAGLSAARSPCGRDGANSRADFRGLSIRR